jgi:DNA-binding protein HU-beta
VSKIPVNKAEVIDRIAEQADLSKAAAARALNAILEFITESLKSGKSVSLLGFGTFDVKDRAERTGRNPRTGEAITIKAAKMPQFKAGKVFKDAVNSASEQ